MNEKKSVPKVRIEKAENKSAVFDFKSLLKREKEIKIVLVGALALIVLFFVADAVSGIGGGTARNESALTADEALIAEHERRLEEKLTTAISAIDGVGQLTVVVTLDSLAETVYADRGSGVVTVITPKVRGAAIICEGGGDIVVKQKIVELASRVLGISSARISVTN